MPRKHPLYSKLEELFKNGEVLKNQATFEKAGFKTLYLRPTGHVRIAKHARFPKYIFKVYLDSEFKQKGELTNDQWLTQRCYGAAQIRTLIEKYAMKYLKVPNKWLFQVRKDKKIDSKKSKFILVADDMQILSREKSKEAWLRKATPTHIRELYIMLKHGYGSGALPINVPFTKFGTIAVIDTEYGRRTFHLPDIKRHLSLKMHKEWDKLLGQE
jgi:hypothetical protein